MLDTNYRISLFVCANGLLKYNVSSCNEASWVKPRGFFASGRSPQNKKALTLIFRVAKQNQRDSFFLGSRVNSSY